MMVMRDICNYAIITYRAAKIKSYITRMFMPCLCQLGIFVIHRHRILFSAKKQKQILNSFQ